MIKTFCCWVLTAWDVFLKSLVPDTCKLRKIVAFILKGKFCSPCGCRVQRTSAKHKCSLVFRSLNYDSCIGMAVLLVGILFSDCALQKELLKAEMQAGEKVLLR